ncbi:hypothetical protein MRS44_016226 [Fusarium solani]|uniref:uncharacterized protein n=1 Tax=Fusarium solani TaxID=169388 RepID=UPI0032C42499|nr:hypothetical protein MRS44_016226 [Fusarium solani]
MHFTTIVASIAALAMGASAAPASGPYDPFAQVRLYPQSDCEQPNVGYVSVRRSGINKCGQLDGTYTIKSLNIEQITENAKGCTLYTFSDVSCKEDRQEVSVGSCHTGAKQYGSYLLSCK